MKRINVRKGAAPSAAVLAVAAIAANYAMPRTKANEGLITDRSRTHAVTYIDRIGRGKPGTICYGQTGFVRGPDGKLYKVKLGLRFPVKWCDVLLKEREQQDLIPIWRITPGIAKYPRCWGAVLDFTHNFNITVYAKSATAREFGRGNWYAGARAFELYSKARNPRTGVKQFMPGLHDRRVRERRDCERDFREHGV